MNNTETPIPRLDFVLLFDVKGGNPNGDPDAGNAPRIDPETGHGIVSDVCLKRKIRNYVAQTRRDDDGNVAAGYRIFVQDRVNLNTAIAEAHEATGGMPPWNSKDRRWVPTVEKVGKASAWMCQQYYDVRSFGAVMSTGPNAGQVRGPVQLAFSRSVDPILPLEISITRCAVADNDIKGPKIGSADFRKWQQEQPEDQLRTMGRKEIIPYALYRCHGFINPFLAGQTGFSRADLDLLWEALKNMFEHDRSAARGEMTAQKLFVFEHASPLGSAPAHRLFERVQVKRKNADAPPRAFSDYHIDPAPLRDLPEGVTLHELL